MRKLWTIMVVLGMANVVAVGGFIGWLIHSDRLDMERVREIRKMLSETVEQQKAREAAAAAEAKAAEEAAKKNALPAGPAYNASELVAMRLEATQVDEERIQRLRREVEDLQLKLRHDQVVLDQQSDTFKKERDEFNAMRDRLRKIEGSEQFKKSVGVLESMKPVDGKALLNTLIDQGQMEQAVSYLNAIEDRVRTQIMTQFVKDGQQELAAQLLESLRTRGLEPVANGETPNASGG